MTLIHFFTRAEEVISGAPSTSTPVIRDHVNHAVHSSGNAHYDPPTEIHLDDVVAIFTPAEEVNSGDPYTSNPVSEDHVQHSDRSRFYAGYGLNYVCLKLQSKSVRINDLSVQR